MCICIVIYFILISQFIPPPSYVFIFSFLKDFHRIKVSSSIHLWTVKGEIIDLQWRNTAETTLCMWLRLISSVTRQAGIMWLLMHRLRKTQHHFCGFLAKKAQSLSSHKNTPDTPKLKGILQSDWSVPKRKNDKRWEPAISGSRTWKSPLHPNNKRKPGQTKKVSNAACIYNRGRPQSKSLLLKLKDRLINIMTSPNKDPWAKSTLELVPGKIDKLLETQCR